jgi:hypothetical protein
MSRPAMAGCPDARTISGQIDRDLVRSRPVARSHALRPWAQQERVVIPRLTLGISNGQAIDRAYARLDQLCCGHGIVSHCWWSGGDQVLACAPSGDNADVTTELAWQDFGSTGSGSRPRPTRGR